MTGGSRGLGYQMVKAFAAHGADVFITSRKLDACEKVAAEVKAMGRKAATYACNVANWQELEGLADAAYAAFGKVDILVNNAGSSPLAPSSLETPEQLFDRIVSLNFKGPFRLMSLVGSRMAAGEGGSIINISSAGALRPRPSIAPYAGAKAALNALTEAFAFEYGPKVRVNTISPGRFLTDVSKAWPRGAQAQPDGGAQAQRPAGGDRHRRALSRFERIEFHHRIAGPGRRRNCLMKDESRRRIREQPSAARRVRSPSPSPSMSLEVDLDPPGEGEVLVKVGGAGLCHSDLSLINGDRPRPVPIVLGHEGAGEIVELGAGVHDVKVGDHVCFTFNVALRPLPALPRRPALYLRALGHAARRRPAPVRPSSAASRRQAGEPSVGRVVLRRVCGGRSRLASW